MSKEIEMLEALGVDRDEARERVIRSMAAMLLDIHHPRVPADDDDFYEYRSRVERRLMEHMDKTLTTIIEAKMTEVVAPLIEQLVNGFEVQMTNEFGEPKGPKQTWTEILLGRAQKWLDMRVEKRWRRGGYELEPVPKVRHNYKQAPTRLAAMVDMAIEGRLEKSYSEFIEASSQALGESLKATVMQRMDVIAGDYINKFRQKMK